MNTPKLPPLPHWCEPGSPFAEQMQAYAIAAIQAQDNTNRVVVSQGVSDGIFESQIEPRPLLYPLSDYHRAMADGPLHHTWIDKPHRLVYDLIAAVRYYASAQPAPQGEQHHDDAAVDRFAVAMKDKLATARQKGRGGWETCSAEDLGRMLREHVEKGDPRDVANFCMFLWSLGHGIAPQASVVQQEHLASAQVVLMNDVQGVVDWLPHQGQPIKVGDYLYTHPAQQAKPQPLSAREIWDNDAIMEVNADATLPFEMIERFVRAIEAAHGIVKE